MTELEKLKDPAKWRSWGPYLSERQWATIREDYSATGDAWNYTTHESARSKAFRWGEEGLAGICDDKQFICFALALWNGNDPILKERLFGLTNGEGNHGEDVKELYYYLDNMPSHSYMKMLYKYPQGRFPYENLLSENAKRTRLEAEYEIADTGIFSENKYFDVLVEYAKNDDTDILISYSITNRGAEAAEIHVLPTAWFRKLPAAQKPSGSAAISILEKNTLLLHTTQIGDYYLYADGSPAFLFTENETNNEKLYQAPNITRHVKDGINEFVVNGNHRAVNSDEIGTKAAALYRETIAGGEQVTIRLRMSKTLQTKPFENFEKFFNAKEMLRTVSIKPC